MSASGQQLACAIVVGAKPPALDGAERPLRI
jgi:hypothetical protein